MVIYIKHYFTNDNDLKEEDIRIKYEQGSYSFTFQSNAGVFSKNKIDYGSKLLLETFLLNNTKENPAILDFGCGYGFLGIVLAKTLNISVDMLDINKRAVLLTEKNIQSNKVSCKVTESDGYEKVTKQYDVIITNPPIKVGKQITLNILMEAKNHLKDDGELWFVMRKDHGVKSVVKCLEKYYICQEIKKNKGFYIILCKKH